MLGVAAPAALAAEPNSNTRSVVASIAHDVDVPPATTSTRDHRPGRRPHRGQRRLIVVIDGSATLTGASARSMVVINGSAALEAGTRRPGDVRTFDGTVTQATGASSAGTVRSFDRSAGAVALFLIPLFLLLFLGLGIAGLAAALLVAAFGARQVRNAEALISREPGTVLVAGIVGSVVLPILAILTAITVVGAPLGLGALFIVLPAMAFFGWIVAAIFVGDWILGRGRDTTPAERPYLAAVVGVIVLAVAGLIPFVSAIATVFGFGALLVMAWRILRPPTAQTPQVGRRHGTARAEHGLTLEPRR